MNRELEDLIHRMRDASYSYQEATQFFAAGYVKRALIAAQGNQCAAARELKIHRNTFERLMRKYGIRYVGTKRNGPRKKPVAWSAPWAEGQPTLTQLVNERDPPLGRKERTGVTGFGERRA